MVKFDDKPIAHDPDWKGPLKNRSCTDIPCLLIFVAFIICWAAVGYYALISGDVETLLAPVDSEGRKCGIDSEVSNKPYLLFFDLLQCTVIKKRCPTTQICIEKCPKTTWDYASHASDLTNLQENIICKPGLNITDKSIKDIEKFVETEVCTQWYGASKPIVNRCFPIDIPTAFAQEQLQKMQEIFDYMAYAQAILNKITATHKTVVLFISGGALLSILYMLLMKWIALPCVCLAIIGVCGLLFYLTYLCYESYIEDNSQTWLVLTIIVGSIAGLIALLTLCLWQRIYLACQLLKEASRAVMSVLLSLFFPILPWLIELGIIIYSFYIAFCLVSIGDQTFIIEEKGTFRTVNDCICSSNVNYTIGSTCNPEIFSKECKEYGEPCVSIACHLQSVDSPSFMNWLYLIHLLGALWLYFFVSAFGEMTLAATFATWYWTFNKSNVPFFTITVSFWRTLRYHLGTIAFGSLLITICRFFRIALEFIHAQSMQQEQVLGPVGRAIYRCAQCLLACLEKLLKFMNRNAYIVCAIYGRGLCASATDAFSLLMRNIIRLVVLNKLVNWLLFGGKILVTCAMVAISWWYFKNHQTDQDYWWVPTILVACGSYLVASLFFSVYETAVDTIFLCFLEDCERHDGSPEKPYYMTRTLGKVLNLK